MPFYIDENSFNLESDKNENKWDTRPTCCYKQNKQNQKFWSQERCDSAGDVGGIRSSGLVNSEVLQEMLDDKHRSSVLHSDCGPQVRSSVLYKNSEQTSAVQCVISI